MSTLTPYEQIEAIESEADMLRADAFLRRLAEQHGFELSGGLYGQPHGYADPIGTDGTG